MIWPSKKILSFFILTIALVTFIIIVFDKKPEGTSGNLSNNLIAGEKLKVPENPNWQNELAKVSLVNENLALKNEVVPEETVTDSISRSLISNYLALKQNNKLDENSIQKMVDQATKLSEKTSINDPKIALKIVPNNGLVSITKYGEDLGNVLKNNKPDEIKNELEIITQFISSNDPKKIEELDSIILSYETAVNELEKISVPELFVKAHTDIIKGTQKIALALTQMKDVLNDPLKGVSAISLYQEGINSFMGAIRATGNFINQNKIIYKQGSGGYYLLYGI